MKPLRLLVVFVILAFSMAVVVLTVQRYRARPFFASAFYPVAPGALLSWGYARGVSANGFEVYYDRYERVLLVVLAKGGGMEWDFNRRQPVRDRLRIRRQADGVVKEIEWRRDCVIYLDQEGVPIYVSLSPQELRDALAHSQTIVPSLTQIVKDHMPPSLRQERESSIYEQE